MQFRAWVDSEGSVRTVHLAGRLGREHAAELLRVCDEAPGALRVDLSHLVTADAAGLEVLARLRSRGAELAGASPYLALRLETARTAPFTHLRDAGPAGGATESRTFGAGKTEGTEEQ